MFKGGTSLEKLRIIRRFSEDLDLLLVGAYPSHRAAERALKAMIETAAEKTGAGTTRAASGGAPGSFHRSAYLTPPLAHAANPGAVADAAAILLELGQSGGPNPNRVRPVESLLTRQLSAAGFEVDAWPDLAAFEVPVLHPGRTLIEKLLRINNFANDPGAQAGPHGWPRIGRQFYDVWALLGTAEVLDFLGNRPLAGEVLVDCYRVSQEFRLDLPVPRGGFASSPAFDPSGQLAGRLREEHVAAMRDLYYGTDDPPSFDDVLQRVDAHRADLDLG